VKFRGGASLTLATALAGVQGVQAHPQKFWLVENLGKILENVGKILEILCKSLTYQKDNLNI